MNLKGLFLSLALIAATASPLSGQSGKTEAADSLASVSGVVRQKFYGLGSSPVQGAIVKIKFGRDSLTCQTGKSGTFEFKSLPPVDVLLSVTCLSFKPYYAKLKLEPGENIFAADVELDYEMLTGAIVKGKVDLMKRKGDTLVFNAAAMTRLEGDDLSALLEQIPGMELKNGRIYYQGEEVKRAYINGKMIFGDNPMSAANHLAADEVVNVKVYDEQSVEGRLKGRRNTAKEKVIDVTTKNTILSACDLEEIAGIGADANPNADGSLNPRYVGGAAVNLFSENLSLSADGNVNNVNGPGFYDVRALRPGSITTDNLGVAAHASVQKNWEDRLLGSRLFAIYAYERNRNRHNSASVTDYFPTPSNPAMQYRDSSSSTATNYIHRMSIIAFINTAKVRNLKYAAEFDIAGNESGSRTGTFNRSAAGTVTNTSENRLDQSKNWSTSHDISWTGEGGEHKFAPEVRGRFSYGHSGGSGNMTDTLATSSVRRDIRKTLDAVDLSAGGEAGVSATFINTGTSTLNAVLNYSAEYTKKDDIQMADNVYRTVRRDTANTYDHHYENFNHGLNFNLSYSDSYNVNAGVMAGLHLDRMLFNDSFRPSYTAVDRLYLVPSAMVYLKYYGLKFQYEYSRNLPDAAGLQARIDDVNPLDLKAGNPGLEPYSGHAVKVSYNLAPEDKTGAVLTFDLSANLDVNPIVQKYEYFSKDTVLPEYDSYCAPAGSMLWRSVNAGYRAGTTLNISYQHRIDKNRMSYTLTAGYNLSPQYLSQDLTYLSTFAPSFYVMHNGPLWKNSRAQLSSRTSFVMDDNSLGEKLGRRLNENFTASVFQTLPVGFKVSASYALNLTHFIGTPGTDMTTHTLSATLGKSFLKGRLNLSFTVQDALNRGSAFNTVTGNNFVRQNWNPTYGRYYMLFVSYRLRSSSRAPGASIVSFH